MSKNLYIVPHDFTEVGQNALEYALGICQHVEADVRILHVVSTASKIPAAIAKIEEIISKTAHNTRAVLSPIVKVGNIFEDIGKIATQEAAQLIIMGTHGQSGLQKLFRSYAMKVITSVDIPFLIIQKGTIYKELKKVVVPIDLTKESLQVVNLAGDVANIYGATVHVIGAKQNDELLNQQMKNRILIVKNQYDERNVPCTVDFIKDSGSYTKQVFDYVKANEIDLIAIAYHSESLIAQFDTFAQSMITNKFDLPCLVINSKQASALYF